MGLDSHRGIYMHVVDKNQTKYVHLTYRIKEKGVD